MAKTTIMDDQPNRTSLMDSGSPKTRLLTPDDEGDEAITPKAPVVGWLAVIAGPGRGHSREVTFGMNLIGRNDTNTVALDFGDDSISGEDHFRIIYDGRNKKFIVAAGTGQNLVYIGDEPVIDARAIESGTEFTVGQSVLRFVALCGPEWFWPEGGEAD